MGRQSGFDLYRFWHHSDFLWKSGIEEYFANSLLKGLPVLLDLPNRELLEFRVHRLRHLRRFDVSIDDLVLPGQLLGEFRFRHNERLYSCEKISVVLDSVFVWARVQEKSSTQLTWLPHYLAVSQTDVAL